MSSWSRSTLLPAVRNFPAPSLPSLSTRRPAAPAVARAAAPQEELEEVRGVEKRAKLPRWCWKAVPNECGNGTRTRETVSVSRPQRRRPQPIVLHAFFSVPLEFVRAHRSVESVRILGSASCSKCVKWWRRVEDLTQFSSSTAGSELSVLP